MPEGFKVISFKSQKEINKNRQEVLNRKKKETLRQIADIKSNNNTRSGKAKAY